jgi:hypothetical protein
MQLGLRYPDLLDNTGVNQEEANRYLADSGLSKEIVNIEGMQFTKISEVLVEKTKKTADYFISKTPLIEATFMYYVNKENNCFMLGVWNSIMNRGLARLLFFGYYLPKFNSITSDSQHTTQGEQYWKKLIQKAKELNKRVTVISANEGEFDIDNIDIFWGKPASFSDYQIRIYR